MRNVVWSLVVASTALSCRAADPPTKPVVSSCELLARALGGRACVDRVATRQEWTSLAASRPEGRVGTHFVIGAQAEDGNHDAFFDARVFGAATAPGAAHAGRDAHEVFAAVVAPDAPPRAFFTGVSRRAFAGELFELVASGLGPVFAYTLVEAAAEPCAVLEAVHARLVARFAPGVPYVTVLAAAGAATLPTDCALPVLFAPESGVDYEAYTTGVSYGVVRVYRKGTLAAAIENADFNWQNVLVLEQTPFDVPTVIAGAVTATRQGQLSHLNIRSAARGTPNCFLRDADSRFAAWEGKLVRFACGVDSFDVQSATIQEADAWRAAFRPPAADLPLPDLETAPIVALLDVPTATPAEREAAARRFGAKGANLATLYQRIDRDRQLEGWLVPMSAYHAFATATRGRLALPGGPAAGDVVTLVAAMLADPTFRADVRVRRTVLTELRAILQAAPCPASVMDAVRARIEASSGGSRAWRFRSSSNAEDVLGFSGAGLYTSAMGCLADDLDGDDRGPSHCDLDKRSEHGVCSALRAVWASLWELRAFEEREFARIDHARVAMGVLVNERSKGELADVVAFSGDPTTRGDPRYLVDAQGDGLEVVAPEEGTWPETSRLTLSDGRVTQIERVRVSSARPSPAPPVLSNAQLETLGAAFASALAVFPVDDVAPPGRDIVFDTEWKVLSDGRLVIKQIRPFLR